MNYLIGAPGETPRMLIETDDFSQVAFQLLESEIINPAEFDSEGRPIFALISSEKEIIVDAGGI